MRDAPAMGQQAGDAMGPGHRGLGAGSARPRRSRRSCAETERRSAFERRCKRPDGSFGVELGTGVEVVQEDARRWRIVPVERQVAGQVQAERASDRRHEPLLRLRSEQRARIAPRRPGRRQQGRARDLPALHDADGRRLHHAHARPDHRVLPLAAAAARSRPASIACSGVSIAACPAWCAVSW